MRQAGRTDVATVTVSKLCGPPHGVRARRARPRRMAHPRGERLWSAGAASAPRAVATYQIHPLHALSRALGCDARATRSCSVPASACLRSMAAVSK